MANDGALISQKVSTVRNLLTQNKAALFAAVPKHLTADRMIRVACTEIQKNPKLAECEQRSLIGGIVEASQLGLEIGGVLGQAYLVPYRCKVKNGNREEWINVAQLIPGYKGLVEIARRSGQVSTIQARVVHSKDEFEFEFGLNPKLFHKPSMDQDPGQAQFVYAICHLRDGGVQYDLMSVREIEMVRSRSRSKDNGPWVTDWEEMAKKTVLRRLCKLLPVSVEIQRAVALDENDDRYRKPINLGEDLSLALPPAPELADETEPEPEHDATQPKGTAGKLAEKQRRKAATTPEIVPPDSPNLPTASTHDNIAAYIKTITELADCDLTRKEIDDARAADQITAEQHQSLMNKLEIKATILRGDG